MRTLSPVSVLLISGFTWFFIGVMLLIKGLGLAVSCSAISQASAVFLPMIAKGAGDWQQGALILITIAVFLGFLKGRIVLTKSANRIIKRIASFQGKVPVSKMYEAKYYILVGSMMLLGLSLKFFPIPLDIKAFIDIAVGSALMNGAMVYFRSLWVKNYL